MGNELVITVITPSFNQGGYLAQTIESVIGQEGDFSLDYIVVDGGSTDNSAAILKHYENLLEKGRWNTRCKEIRYRWISEKDKGQADAIRKGFGLAEGDVFAWLNSDDVLLPNTLQTVAAFFREHPAIALVYGDAHYIDAGGEIIGRYPAEAFDLGRLAFLNFFCQPSTFFRRQAFEEVGGLDLTLHYGMDYDLFVRIAKQFDCHYLPQFFSKYRLHESSKTVCSETLLANHEETLQLVLRHFGWAPLNRVYGACNHYWLDRLPACLKKYRLFAVLVSGGCTIYRSLRLNRGFRKEDLKLLTLTNMRKIFKDRFEILTG